MNIRFTENAKKDKTLKVICPKCQHETNHEVVASIETNGCENSSENGDEFWWYSKHQIIKCLGCETLSFRRLYEDSNLAFAGLPAEETLYPKRSIDELKCKEFHNIPSNICQIYKDTIESYNNGALTLCAAGLRALVEAICFENNIIDGFVDVKDDMGTVIGQKKIYRLEDKIDCLFQKCILTEKNAVVLHELRFLGNDALHKMVVPTKEELRIATEIIDDILASIYEIPQKQMQLQSVRGRFEFPDS